MSVEVLWYHLGIPWYFDMFHDIEQLPCHGNYIILQVPSKNTMVVLWLWLKKMYSLWSVYTYSM